MTDYQQSCNCNCNCGTKLILDQQLINQRQEWREKYHCLQKQVTKDIGLMKQKIYQECSSLMQNEFNKKERQNTECINKKNLEIQQLTSKIIKIQTAYKISEKEKQVLQGQFREQIQKYNQKDEELSSLKKNHRNSIRELQDQNLSETGILRARIFQQNEQIQNKLQLENSQLKEKLKQLQLKYQGIIPEITKLTNNLTRKTNENEGLKQQLSRLNKIRQKQTNDIRKRLEQTTQIHLPCSSTINQLQNKILDLQSQIQKGKSLRRQVKVEPVYIERPVQVERIVQRIIEVEKIVKQYIEPEVPVNYKQIQQQSKKVNKWFQQLMCRHDELKNQYQNLSVQNDDTVRALQQNITKYQQQREGLVNRIKQQDEQLQKIYQMMMLNGNSQARQDQKIVIMVNKDGTYNKRVQKVQKIEQRIIQTGTVPKLKGKDVRNDGYKGTKSNYQKK